MAWHGKISHVFPQGLLLESKLFLPMLSIVFFFITKINFNCYADYTQFYLPIKPHEAISWLHISLRFQGIRPIFHSCAIVLNLYENNANQHDAKSH